MEPTKSKLKSCLWGCLITFLVLVIVMIGSLYWLFKKGDFQEETTILASNSDFYLRAYFNSEDTVLTAFFLQRMRDMQSLAGGDSFPEFFKKYQEWKSKRDLKKLLPLEIELTGSISEERLRGAVGFSLYNNMARIAFYFLEREAKSQGHLRRYGSHTFVVTEDGKACFDLLNNHILFSGDEESMQRTYDAIQASAPTSDPRLAQIDTGAPIYGFLAEGAVRKFWIEMVGENLEVDGGSSLLRSTESEAFFSQVSRVAFQLFVVDEETLKGEIHIDTPTSAEGKAYVERSMAALAEEADLKIDSEVTEAAGGYLVKVIITGFDTVSLP